MEKTSIYKFYRLGQLLNEFKTDEEPTNIELYNRIANFFDFVEELNLQVTSSAITLGDIKKHHKRLDKESQENPKKIVSTDLVKKVNASVNKLLTTFEAEILNKNSFVLSDKKFPTKHLIDNQTLLFENENVLLIAPFDVQFNIMESAFCLAFDRNTASSFHMLLATEEYVRFFNNLFLEENEEDETITFFNLIKETEEILDDIKHNSELTSFLHIIRKYYRNQSQHSNRKFTESEATELFNICIKVMNEMYKIIEKTLPNTVYN
ncbi:hypothetical protein FPF71_15100 [Algibacter amylolyticus]|uniref:DUF4145 domain-containing protein n=1 Tax=Algibacter amylolyticus TaxID=1608400 RepID=A0A5M7AZ98_9FLAO|nr:hypothetical protein [Algibacter amylolyticus]KAA5822469.1 hypothetical protein F2B50_15100 [Algibacter amylolyticus]MBB5269194.1 hypothetical protein [Algibacter amylolyticus]TSJ73619.1 hypothetical protein FPF71_15100 [Algibacter amylolyticus]